ncbi:exosortase F system-associated membrane protein [Flavobacteriaceae bacterium M23B6Z8]
MKTFSKIAWSSVLILLLVAIRMFEDKLFYDPFLNYFEHGLYHGTIPEFDGWWLFLNHLFRYALNLIISLLLLWVLFKNVQFVKIAAVLYATLFLVLIIAYFILIAYSLEEHHLMTFYVRRFLIQPLLIFILIPAFYYQIRTSKSI